MATVRLHDANLSGYVEWTTDDGPEDVQASIPSGTWWETPAGDGAVLLSSEWSADYFVGGADDRDPYPDCVLSEGDGVQPA